MFRNPFRKPASSIATADPYEWLYTDGYTAEDKEILEQHMDLMFDGDTEAAGAFLAEHGWNEDYALSAHAHFFPYTEEQIDAAREALASLRAGEKADVIHAGTILAQHNLTVEDMAECNKHYWAEVRTGLRDHVYDHA